MKTVEIMDYITEQPEILRNIVENRKEILKDFIAAYQANKVSKIILTGSGSSYNASVSSRHFIEKLLKVETHVEFAYTFNKHLHVFSRDTLVFSLSQSGESTAAVHCLEKANQLELLSVAVTSQDDSLITEYAKNKIIVPSGEEKAGATTKGYTSTVLTLYLMAIETAYQTDLLHEEKYKQYISQLKAIIGNMGKSIEAAEEWYKEHKEELLSASNYIVTGYGDNYGTAMEGGLKFLETSRVPVSVYELEEFMHGPYNAIDENSYIFFIGTPGDGKERMMKLVEYFSSKTPHGYVITKKSECHTPGSLAIDFIDDEDLSPIEYIVPLQVLFFRTAKDRGVNMRTPRYVDFHPYMNSKRRLRFL
ncbi:SIS domain-containing protein [Ammoniphilus sp. 3BR4]|uniref:SIS domain-containing protein n=1 Tax=Ammoniphilus sp. 3BR4 TaxID=3158265 RepID=UPI003466FD24